MPRIQESLGLLASVLVSGSLLADTFAVTKLEDDNGPCTPDDCSIREAIIAANALPGPDRVELPAGVHTLTIPGADPAAFSVPASGDLDILDELTLIGDPNSPTVVSGSASDRVLDVEFTEATLINIELTGGRDLLSSGGCVRLLRSDITFINTSITNCFCEQAGGGLALFSSAATLLNSTVSNNESGLPGGGIAQITGDATQFLEIVNSTISGNRSATVGGGLFHSSGSLYS